MAQKIGLLQVRSRYPRRQADLGLQAERTALAWYRTIFVCLVNSLLLLRNALKLESVLFWVLSAVMLALTAALYLYSCVHNVHLKTTKPLPSRAGLRLKMILTGVLAICSASLVWHFLLAK